MKTTTLTKEEIRDLMNCFIVLNRHWGGDSWKIDVGSPYSDAIHSGSNITITVNGSDISFNLPPLTDVGENE